MSEDNSNSTDFNCAYNYSRWWVFPAVFGCLYFLGLLSVIVYTVLHRIGAMERIILHVMILRHKAMVVISMDSVGSKVFIVSTTLANLLYMLLFLYRTSLPVHMCLNPTSIGLLFLELSIVCFLMINFFFRLMAAKSFLNHWISLLHIVDMLTLFQPAISLIIGYDWLGLRALRFLWLKEVTNLIFLLPVNISEDIVKVTNIATQFLGIWLATSGIIHLLESSGDPWNQEETRQDLSFWKSTYFIIVTLSTVGYGDVTMETTCGHVVTMLFIIGGLAAYAVALPSLIDITISYYRSSKYRSAYETTRFNDMIIVCGHVTAQSVADFLKELLHPDKHDNRTHVVFLHPTAPSEELEQVLKTCYTRVHYIMGSPLSSKDLQHCSFKEAKALIILADRMGEDPLDEDRANLLRTIAVKNCSSSVRVILQLLSPSSKQMLSSVPGWNPQSDVVLCLNELKLSILAQSCLTPGFCTFLSNLLFAVAYKQVSDCQRDMCVSELSWKQLYIDGACNEVYSTTLSNYFIGMEVGQLGLFCFEQLGLTLLAIDPLTRVVTKDTVGYFIADTAKEVLQAATYTSSFSSTDLQDLISCSQDKNHKLTYLVKPQAMNPIPLGAPIFCELPGVSISCMQTPELTQSQPLHSTPLAPPTFYPPLPPAALTACEQATDVPPLVIPPLPPLNLTNHIVLCIFADKNSIGIGLSCFVSSLPASSSVVIVTNHKYMKREWSNMTTSCSVYFVPGSPLDWACLEKACVSTSRVCVLLTACTTNHKASEYAINDKEVVLATLKLKQLLGDRVMVLTDLVEESHVHLLDGKSQSTDLPIFMAEPFACGHIFVSSVFDSLTTVAFHSPGTIVLLENVLSPGDEGTNWVLQIPLSSDDLSHFSGKEYFQLYRHFCLRNILCVGIYRQLYPATKNRFIITAPRKDLLLMHSDIVFAIKLIEH